MISEFLQNHLNHFHLKLTALLPHIGAGIILFALFWIAGLIIKSVILRLAKKSKSRRYLFNLLGQTSKIALILIGLVSALGTIGINVTAMVTSLGLVGFALGFALKDFLSNIIAGFIILFYHPFKIGDTISIGSTSGEVHDINLRYTVIYAETERFLIPNSSLLTSTISVTQSI